MPKDPLNIPIQGPDETEEEDPRLKELEEKLAAAEAALAQVKDESLRRAADLENTRKRLIREHERACDAAALRVIERLLPILDDLARAIDAIAADAGVPPQHVDALRLLARRVYDVLQAEGLEVIWPQPGDVFDAEVHEAVLTTCDGTQPPGTIVKAVNAGYRFKGLLLKAAAVEVCIEGSAVADGGQ